MTVKFTARDIHVESTEEHVMVGFADGTDLISKFIVVMRVRQGGRDIPDEIVAKPYFEYADKTQSGFGCIKSVTLRNDRVTFRIDTTTCPDIPDREFVVVLDIDQMKLSEIADRLRDILGDTAQLRIIGD